MTTNPGRHCALGPGSIVAGLSGRQISVDHVNGFPVPITSHGQSTGGLLTASGTRRYKYRPNFQYRFSSILLSLGYGPGHCNSHDNRIVVWP